MFMFYDKVSILAILVGMQWKIIPRSHLASSIDPIGSELVSCSILCYNNGGGYNHEPYRHA